MLTPERTQLIHSIAPMYRALYLNQPVGIVYWPGTVEPDRYTILPENIYADGYLSLRSVKDLTGEEVWHVTKLIYGDSFDERKGQIANVYQVITTGDLLKELDKSNLRFSVTMSLIGYLRGIGIALPYYTATTGLITVEEFIEAGTIVINPNQSRA